jgi:predicted nucleic acid-binding protein
MTSDVYVIDSNVLFGAFISGKDVYSIIFSEKTVYVPDFAFVEIEKYKQRILEKTKLSGGEFQEFILRLLKNVTVIPALAISQDSLKQAYELCREIDDKDTVYVAAAIQLEATLVTSDRSLLKGLRERGFNRVELLGDVVRHELSQTTLGEDTSR